MAPQSACEPFITAAEFIEDDCTCNFELPRDAALVDAVIDMASDVLYWLSGGRVAGRCEATVRPVGEAACLPRGFWASIGTPAGHQGGLNVIPLRGPMTEIVEIVIDGEVLDPDTYSLLDGTYLFRKNGQWPSTQDLTLDDTEVGTWSITYRFNPPIDFVTKDAAAEIACELGLPLVGRPSRFGPGVTSANIQGASIAIRDAAESDSEGLPRTARFLSIFAPGGRNRSGVWSPELAQGWSLFQVGMPEPTVS